MERRCGAQTISGNPCKQFLKENQEHCWHHQGPQCSVCLGHMNRDTRQLPCNHVFHARCVERWKSSCRETPTCPMCRTPFDVPVYRCRLIIERVSDGNLNVRDFETSNMLSMIESFGVTIERGQEMLRTEIHWDVGEEDDLNDELLQLGLPLPEN